MRNVVLALTVLGCSERGLAVGAVPRENLGPDTLTIVLDGACPGQMVFAWQGAASDELAGLLFALNTGNYILSHICQGTVLGLGSHQLQLVRSFRTGPDGRGEMSGPAPRRACGGYVQMIVVDGICTTSNVVQIPQ